MQYKKLFIAVFIVALAVIAEAAANPRRNARRSSPRRLDLNTPVGKQQDKKTKAVASQSTTTKTATTTATNTNSEATVNQKNTEANKNSTQSVNNNRRRIRRVPTKTMRTLNAHARKPVQRVPVAPPMSRVARATRNVREMLYRNQLAPSGAVRNMMEEVPHVNRLTSLLKGLAQRSQFKQQQTANNLASVLGREGRLPGYYEHDRATPAEAEAIANGYDAADAAFTFMLENPAQPFHQGFPNVPYGY